MSRAYEIVKPQVERIMALKSALTLFEWDNETQAPARASGLTAQVIEALSGEYFDAVAGGRLEELLARCRQAGNLEPAEAASVRELEEELERIRRIPPREYREFSGLTARATSVWAQAREEGRFERFAPVLEQIVDFQKRFASLRAGEGEAAYDVMLGDYEKGFSMKTLDPFFNDLREELVPFLQRIEQEGTQPENAFLRGDYPKEKQAELARFLAEYAGFDFQRGVLAVSAHPFTTSLHNRDVRITTHYTDRVDSSLFSVIHEAGHGIYEQGISDELTLTPAGQGASMGMHESQSRFFENIIGRSPAFWVPIYGRLQELFPEQLGQVSRERFVRAINRVEPGLIRTEADELTYSLHILIRYELERMLIEEALPVQELPQIWADRYERYLGIRPGNAAEGVLQDIHWSQGSFGYFPSYALGSAFGAQLYAHMKTVMDFEGLLERGELLVIREYLREQIHRFGKEKTSRQLLRDVTGEDFDSAYYIQYLKEKYGRLYGLS